MNRSTHRHHLVPLHLLMLLPLACSDATAPARSEIRLDLTLSRTIGDAGHPIEIDGLAFRTGTESIGYFRDCCHPDVDFRIFDPAGRRVYLEPPLLCRCAEVRYEFPRGKAFRNEIQFTGAIWLDGQSGPAGAGRYTVEVRFNYVVGDAETPLEVRESATFLWLPDGDSGQGQMTPYTRRRGSARPPVPARTDRLAPEALRDPHRRQLSESDLLSPGDAAQTIQCLRVESDR